MSIKKSATSMGVALAFAAAGLAGTTSIASAAEEGASANVHCFGVNKCAGHNDCKTASNACKGMASCKGKGYVSMPKASCEHMGGEVK